MSSFDVFAATADDAEALAVVRATTLLDPAFASETPRAAAGPVPVTFVILTRDAEQTVARCLHSIPVEASVLVLDSESRDRTREVVAEIRPTARIVVRAWTDDFSEARNAALDLASPGWVVYVDADEFLLHGHGRRVLTVAGLLERHPARNRMRCGLALLDKSVGVTPFLPRMMRAGGEVRWSNPLHEGVVPTDPEGVLLDVALDVTIAHDGYSRDDVDRAVRNRGIIASWLVSDPTDGRAHLALAQELTNPDQHRDREGHLAAALADRSLTEREQRSVLLSSLVNELLSRGPAALLVRLDEESTVEPGLEEMVLKARALQLLHDVELPHTRSAIAEQLLTGAAADPEDDLARRAVDALLALSALMGEDSHALAQQLSSTQAGAT